MRSLTWSEAHSRRLARGHLLERTTAEGLAGTVSDVCGVQAQVQGAAELGLGARVAGATREEVRRALWQERSLVKTWTIRGTLHLHRADELPLWLSALTAEPYWHDPAWLSSFGLTAEEADVILNAIVDALDGRLLTRRELGDEVERRAGSWVKRETGVVQFGGRASTWVQLLGAAAVTGRLCHGPKRGAETTLVRADQWLGGWRELDPDDALLEVARRYLRTYGPARPDDLARWLGVERDRARSTFDRLARELEEVDVEGRRACLLADDGAPSAGAEGSVCLLPQYDAYVLGCRFGRERVVTDAVATRLRSHPRGRYEVAAGHSVLLLDGVVAGMWERTARGKRLEIRVEPFRRLSGTERRSLDDEGARIGDFLGVAHVALTTQRLT